MTRVLVVHHDLDLAGMEADSLRRFGYDVTECGGPSRNRCPVMAGQPCDLAERADVLVYDVWADQDAEGARVLIETIREVHPDTPVVLTSPGLALSWQEDEGPRLGHDAHRPADWRSPPRGHPGRARHADVRLGRRASPNGSSRSWRRRETLSPMATSATGRRSKVGRGTSLASYNPLRWPDAASGAPSMNLGHGSSTRWSGGPERDRIAEPRRGRRRPVAAPSPRGAGRTSPGRPRTPARRRRAARACSRPPRGGRRRPRSRSGRGASARPSGSRGCRCPRRGGSRPA